ncbi:MAG TPA: LysM peptidoglycan-binding domain-containing protein [Gammaproteobacteria bacterium]|nr:LysM peptidoglycan-binding domain-containing protein [Gammaproteobacteria bacterium]
MNIRIHPPILTACFLMFLSGCSSLATIPETTAPPTRHKLVFVPEPVQPPPPPVSKAKITPKVVFARGLPTFSLQGGDTVWSRIQSKAVLNFDSERRQIIRERKRYTRNPAYLRMVTQRSEPFIYYIVEALKAADLPEELALLPIIESAYVVNAKSRHGASGLWQFIASTGKRFGLKRNWWYDGRKDIVASTIAATQYLKQLNQLFDGDWLLALAAYNAGENSVQKAIKRNKARGLPTDFWSLRLPRETTHYVPRFLAVLSIIQNPELYDVELWPIADTSYFTEIPAGKKLSLEKIAKNLGTNKEVLKLLNAGLKRATTPPDQNYQLLLPNSVADNYYAAINEQLSKLQANNMTHKVSSGETLSQIGKYYGVSVVKLKASNQLKSSRIHTGQLLNIPES